MNGLYDSENPPVENPYLTDAAELHQIDAKLAGAESAKASLSSDAVPRTGDNSLLAEIGDRQYSTITEADARLSQAGDVSNLEISEQADMDQVVQQLSQIEGLHPENWQAASLDQRQQVLEQAGNVLSDIYGTSKPTMEVKALEDGYSGFYHSETDMLTMSQSEVMSPDPKKALSTYTHEFRHAYQWDQIERYSKGLPAHSDAAAWANNFNHYQKPPTLSQELFDPEGAKIQYDRYQNQPVEADSFSFEKNVVQRVYE